MRVYCNEVNSKVESIMVGTDSNHWDKPQSIHYLNSSYSNSKYLMYVWSYSIRTCTLYSTFSDPIQVYQQAIYSPCHCSGHTFSGSAWLWWISRSRWVLPELLSDRQTHGNWWTSKPGIRKLEIRTRLCQDGWILVGIDIGTVCNPIHVYLSGT